VAGKYIPQLVETLRASKDKSVVSETLPIKCTVSCGLRLLSEHTLCYAEAGKLDQQFCKLATDWLHSRAYTALYTGVG
jgi:hypothetical protein